MNAFDFIQATICHDLKDPLSESLEPDCLSPRIAITTQSLKGKEHYDFPPLQVGANRSSGEGNVTTPFPFKLKYGMKQVELFR